MLHTTFPLTRILTVKYLSLPLSIQYFSIILGIRPDGRDDVCKFVTTKYQDFIPLRCFNTVQSGAKENQLISFTNT